MKSDTQERLRKMMEADRGEMNEKSAAAAQKEFMHIAEEFFETDGEGKLTVESGKRDMLVTFSVRAKRVKNFTTL